MPPSVAPHADTTSSFGPEHDDAPQNRAMIHILQFLVDAADPETVARRAATSLRLLPEVASAELRNAGEPGGDLRAPLAGDGESLQHLVVDLVHAADPVARARVAALVDLAVALHGRAWQVRRLADAARSDPLTKLCNRRAFEPFVDQALARAGRTGETVALVLCDIDDFKSINDGFGHHAGDDALVAVSHVLRTSVRPTDVAARLGGDEFALLLACASAEGAARVAVRIRDAMSCANPLTGRKLTLSIGIADNKMADLERMPIHEARQALFRAADMALYRVKASGRNGFAIAPARVMGPPTIAAREVVEGAAL